MYYYAPEETTRPTMIPVYPGDMFITKKELFLASKTENRYVDCDLLVPKGSLVFVVGVNPVKDEKLLATNRSQLVDMLILSSEGVFGWHDEQDDLWVVDV